MEEQIVGSGFRAGAISGFGLRGIRRQSIEPASGHHSGCQCYPSQAFSVMEKWSMEVTTASEAG